MKFHPILFSTEMVQAIMEGCKTQTRRAMPEWCNYYSSVETVINPELCDPKAAEWNELKPKQYYGLYASFDKGEEHLKSKYGQPGDVLWVRESWQHWLNDKGQPSGTYMYKSSDENINGIGWKPSIHMPKSACRIFLQIKNIRVERLQDISENDAIKEGINLNNISGDWERPPTSEFQNLWERINGEESWESNPWVWVIEFERIEKPKDLLLK